MGMIATRLAPLAFAVAICSVALMGCGDDGETPVDAPHPADAGVDAVPNTLIGLSQSCGPNLPACPAEAPICREGLCTLACHPDASLTTNASGQIVSTTPASFIPDNPACAAAYHGGVVGEPICGAIFNVVPPDSPLQPSKTYAFDAVCQVSCLPQNTCPAGLTCRDLECFP